LRVRSLLLPGFQDPYKSVLLQSCMRAQGFTLRRVILHVAESAGVLHTFHRIRL
jgi:hypothetical protein